MPMPSLRSPGRRPDPSRGRERTSSDLSPHLSPPTAHVLNDNDIIILTQQNQYPSMLQELNGDGPFSKGNKGKHIFTSIHPDRQVESFSSFFFCSSAGSFGHAPAHICTRTFLMHSRKSCRDWRTHDLSELGEGSFLCNLVCFLG